MVSPNGQKKVQDHSEGNTNFQFDLSTDVADNVTSSTISTLTYNLKILHHDNGNNFRYIMQWASVKTASQFVRKSYLAPFPIAILAILCSIIDW